jgi:hypothetical protein
MLLEKGAFAVHTMISAYRRCLLSLLFLFACLPQAFAGGREAKGTLVEDRVVPAARLISSSPPHRSEGFQ